ncbi:acyltransferase family protein [Sodalis sp. C49]|uniref:acyltransferase family protein n=1 Tax=Sodalis sp. C49 TaxID=3228929 RepID=UPI003965D0E1
MKLTIMDTNCLKGIAILMMLTHHLFSFPEKVLPPSIVYYLIPGLPIERYFGLMCKLCVPIFLFLSGYAFYIIGVRNGLYYFKKILSFYKSYWFVFIIFVPIGFLFFSEINGSPFKKEDIILNLIGISSSFNKEWWFVEVYVVMVASLPFVNMLRDKPITLFILSLLILFLGFYWNTSHFRFLKHISNIFIWSQPFFTGYIVGRFDIYSMIRKIINYKGYQILFVYTVFLSIFVLLFHFMNYIGLFIVTPFFIVLSMVVIKKIGKLCEVVLVFLGENSMNIWLTHSFLCYYYTQYYIYFPKLSILVFLNLLFSSLIISLLLNKIKYFFELYASKFLLNRT